MGAFWVFVFVIFVGFVGVCLLGEMRIGGLLGAKLWGFCWGILGGFVGGFGWKLRGLFVVGKIIRLN